MKVKRRTVSVRLQVGVERTVPVDQGGSAVSADRMIAKPIRNWCAHVLLQLSGICKRFASLTAVADVYLRVDQGEAVGIIGPNGAGKTTLFNVITGDLKPDAGEIKFREEPIGALDAAERCKLGLGRTYQIPHPFSGMTVYENVIVGAAFGSGLSEAEGSAIAIEAMERTGLDSKANVLAGTLALLDRKRLELARALATRPQLLLLDEIAGGLTDHEVNDLIQVINALRKEGVAIIWIEHITHALIAVVDRLVAMNFGKVLIDGAPNAVMDSRDVREIYLGISGE